MTWTVDFVSQFDQKSFLNVQVASPYMHANRGEGIYAFPEVGSKCLLCIPSDGPPPFILAFIMPQETISDTSSDEAPAGTESKGGDTNEATGFTFGGGRFRPKPGDIYMKGRDGQFCILHRGGVLQIGSTMLAQRIFIPLGNVVKDISQNYHHYNTGGTISWSVATAPSEDNPPTTWKQTFRLSANEDKATIRVAVGTISDVVGEHKDGTGNQAEIDTLGIGSNLIYEVALAPELFGADDGSVQPDTTKGTKLRFFFNKNGGAYLGCAGNVLLATKQKLRVKAGDDIEITTDKNFRLQAEGITRIEGKKLLELAGGVVRIGPGTDNVAHVGSVVIVTIPPGIPLGIAPPGGGPVPSNPLTITGLVSTGKPTVLV
jgi:hypothetical protein